MPIVGAKRGNGCIGRLKPGQAEIEDGGDQEVSDVGGISGTLTIKPAESGS